MEVKNTNFSFTSANNSVQTLKVQNAVENYQKKVEKNEDTKSAEITDTYTKGTDTVDTETGIYSKESIQKTVEQMEAQRAEALSNMISEMLGQQANAKGLNFIGSEIISAPIEDIKEAQASIEEGGYWSVDAVATRIMDMASLLANGDSSKLSLLKDAIIQGFDGAISDFGRESLDDMPDITRNTYDEVMKRFDEFEKELTGTTETSETEQAEVQTEKTEA